MDHFNRLFLLSADESSALERALIGVAYWLDCSPHEQTPEDAVAMAKFIRMMEPRFGKPLHASGCECALCVREIVEDGVVMPRSGGPI